MQSRQAVWLYHLPCIRRLALHTQRETRASQIHYTSPFSFCTEKIGEFRCAFQTPVYGFRSVQAFFCRLAEEAAGPPERVRPPRAESDRLRARRRFFRSGSMTFCEKKCRFLKITGGLWQRVKWTGRIFAFRSLFFVFPAWRTQFYCYLESLCYNKKHTIGKNSGSF